jgi:rRNA maturation endonuclease Nob1
MTEGCDHIAPMESDQEEGYCEKCGGNTKVSVLVLADLM